MSVKVPDRNTSDAQFISTARMLEKETRNRCINAPKRYTFYGLHEFWLTSRRIHSCVKRANSFNLAKDDQRIKRESLFVDAIVHIQDYISQLELLVDDKVLTTKSSKVLSELVFKELNLIKAVMKSDKKRTKNQN